jgi:hypothetical protein
VTSLLQLGALAMIAVDAVVGVRLLLLALRTRQIPETSLGVAFVLLGAIGYPCTTAARRGLLPTDEANQVLMAAGLLVQDAGCFGIYLMTAYTFHAGRRAARIATIAAGVAFVATWIGHGLHNGFEPHGTGTAYYAGLAVRAGGFAWVCRASLHEYGLARRRMRLGLVDPLVTNRFLLFGLGTGGVLAAFLLFFVGQITSENVAETTWVLAATGTAGLFAAVPTWLAFVPPTRYKRYFDDHALLVR